MLFACLLLTFLYNSSGDAAGCSPEFKRHFFAPFEETISHPVSYEGGIYQCYAALYQPYPNALAFVVYDLAVMLAPIVLAVHMYLLFKHKIVRTYLVFSIIAVGGIEIFLILRMFAFYSS